MRQPRPKSSTPVLIQLARTLLKRQSIRLAAKRSAVPYSRVHALARKDRHRAIANLEAVLAALDPELIELLRQRMAAAPPTAIKRIQDHLRRD